jgi:hypothetical protein
MGLPISELELGTLAFIPCAFVMYVFRFNKGFDVDHVTMINVSAGDFDDLKSKHDAFWDDHGHNSWRVEDLSKDIFFHLLGPRTKDLVPHLREIIVQLFFYFFIFFTLLGQYSQRCT